jgi:hypothetical protein
MVETVLGGVLIAVVSGSIGKAIGEHNSVKKPICDQIRTDCRNLLVEKIENVGEKVEELTKAVNHKLYGL